MLGKCRAKINVEERPANIMVMGTVPPQGHSISCQSTALPAADEVPLLAPSNHGEIGAYIASVTRHILRVL